MRVLAVPDASFIIQTKKDNLLQSDPMAKILRRYFDKDLQHWIDVYEAEENNHVPTIHVSYKHRMMGAERKIRQVFESVEDSLRQDVRKFIKRRKF